MAVHQDFSHTLKRTRIASVHSTTDDDESTCADDDGCSVSSDHSELIKKPQGHVSRPRSGGYNLAKMLEQSGWTPDQFVKLRLHVHRVAQDTLDTSVSYSHQKKEAIKLVCANAELKFPELRAYEDSWPIIDLLKARLKCTSERARRRLAIELAGKTVLSADKGKGKRS